MEALLIQAGEGRAMGWDALARTCEKASLHLRWGRGLSTALEGLARDPADAVVLLLDRDTTHDQTLVQQVAVLARKLPVLVVGTRDDPLLAEELLGLGVQDLLPAQAVEGTLLVTLVRNAVERFRNASALLLSNTILGVLGGDAPLEPRLVEVVTALRRQCPCSAAGVRLLDPDGGMPFVASSGYEEAFLESARAHVATVGAGACSAVVVGRHPGGWFSLAESGEGVAPRISQSTRVLPCPGHFAGQGCPCALARDDLAGVFPVRVGARVLGVLHLRFPSPRGLSGPLMRSLEAVGLQLGAAVDQARMLGARDLREKRYRALVSAISSAVISLDAEGGMVEPQPEWQAFTGQEVVASLPRAWLEQVHEEDRSLLELLFSRTGACEAVREAWARIFHAPSGKHRACQLRAVPRQGDEGRLLEWIVAVTDVQSERDAAQARAELESNLRQAQRMEMMGKLAGGVAHDFNNLLTIIKGNLYLLAAEAGDEGKAPEELKEIEQATTRASNLTRQLLAFGRRQVVRPVPLDLNVVVGDLEKMLRRVIGEDIRLCVVPGQGLSRVMADPGHMEQVLMNLALRARDSMPRGGTLTIATANASHDGSRVRHAWVGSAGPHVLLSVSDSGPVLDEDAKARIFDPYLQTAPSSVHQGLGLAVVYGIVKQHGGHILVQSAEGVGTTFRVYLPALSEVAVEVEAGGRSRPPRSGLPETLTVLVVEDDAPVRSLVARILKHEGYRVLLAADGAEALALSREHAGNIDLALCDVVMPGMYGPEVVAALRGNRPALPVLYMSGFTDSVVLTEGVLAQGTAFIEKPFTPDALAQSVREALGGASPAVNR